MNCFKWIPEDFQPINEENIEYDCVYRATKSVNELKVDDFLPWIIEHQNKYDLFSPILKNGIRKDMFGVSLFTNLDSLKEVVDKIPDLNRKIKSFSKGCTKSSRGISTKVNKNNHVEYYLYDYKNNNPYSDFEIIEVKTNEE